MFLNFSAFDPKERCCLTLATDDRFNWFLWRFCLFFLHQPYTTAMDLMSNVLYLQLVKLQLISIFTNAKNILQVDGSLNVLHT